MRALVAALAATLVLAAPAGAAMRGVPSPPHVTVVRGDCPFTMATACAIYDPATIYLSRDADGFDRQHELGHLADDQLLDDAERFAIEPLLGVAHGAPWDPGTGDVCFQVACASERFADAYATCRLGMFPRGWHDWLQTGYGYGPRTNAAQRRTCRAMTRFLADPRV